MRLPAGPVCRWSIRSVCRIFEGRMAHSCCLLPKCRLVKEHLFKETKLKQLFALIPMNALVRAWLLCCVVVELAIASDSFLYDGSCR